jgi:hypothetical protein
MVWSCQPLLHLNHFAQKTEAKKNAESEVPFWEIPFLLLDWPVAGDLEVLGWAG